MIIINNKIINSNFTTVFEINKVNKQLFSNLIILWMKMKENLF